MAIPLWKHGICYFPAPKAANTSLKHALHRIRTGAGFVGAEREDGARVHIHQAYGTPLFASVDHSQFADMLRFAVVRDPVDRFLSTWGNRVVFHGELSAEKADAKAMARLGLAYDPDLKTFADRFEDYFSASKSIKLHASPLVDFLGPSAGYYHLLFDIRQIDRIEDFLSLACGQKVKLPHRQTGGPKPSRDELSAEQVARLRRFYAADYEVFGDHMGPAACGVAKGRAAADEAGSAPLVLEERDVAEG